MKIEFDKNLNVTEKIPEEGDIAIKTFLGYVWIKYIFIPYIKYILVTCEPIEAVGCIGWLGSKPIMLEQEL